jgi:hypothetical protein
MTKVQTASAIFPGLDLLLLESYNGLMKSRRQKIKLPLTIAGASLLLISLIVLLTNPVTNIVWTVFFFLGLFVFLYSMAAAAAILQGGEVTKPARQRLLIGVGFIVVTLMLRSAGSLSIVDGVVLVLIVAGLFFYFGRRQA